jgi:quinol monooxygenase YgiN
MVERWRGQSGIDAHFATPHMQTALELAGEHLEGPPQIHPLTPVDIG